MPTQLQALKALVDTVQNPDLLRLESLLSRFNLFEAVGAVRHELRHSDFLAFLLDPSRSHSLGAAFLHQFLRASLDLDAIDLSRAYVLREWHHIDILIVDEASRVAIIIENKIGTGEHSDQLNRYHKTFQSHFPGYQALGLYLTPDGDESSSPKDYRAVSYTLVCEIIEQTTRDNRAMLDAEVVMALEHYTQMLRRHIVSDSDVAKLCRSIYKQHKQALDVIFEHRPDQPTQVGEYAKSLIQQEDEITLGDARKTWITFTLKEWEQSPRFNTELFYLYFEFNNQPNELQIFCTIWPGDQGERQKLFSMAQKHHFTGCNSKLTRGHCRLSIIQVLRQEDYEKTQEEIEAQVYEKWTAFLSDELPRMAQAVREEGWLWELPDSVAIDKGADNKQAYVNSFVRLLIESEPSIKLCYSKKSYIQFNPLVWDGSPLYRDVHRNFPWFLYFQFASGPNNLAIVLLMTPGDPEHRRKVFEAAKKNNFQGCSPELTQLREEHGWNRLFEKIVLTTEDYKKTQDEIKVIASQKWSEFLRDDLPRMAQAIREEKWLWELPQAAP